MWLTEKLAWARQRRQSSEPQTVNSDPWLDLALGSLVTGRQQDTLWTRGSKAAVGLATGWQRHFAAWTLYLDTGAFHLHNSYFVSLLINRSSLSEVLCSWGFKNRSLSSFWFLPWGWASVPMWTPPSHKLAVVWGGLLSSERALVATGQCLCSHSEKVTLDYIKYHIRKCLVPVHFSPPNQLFCSCSFC